MNTLLILRGWDCLSCYLFPLPQNLEENTDDRCKVFSLCQIVSLYEGILINVLLILLYCTYARDRGQSSFTLCHTPLLIMGGGGGVGGKTHCKTGLASVMQEAQHTMGLVVNFFMFFLNIFCFVVVIFDLVHDVEAIHGLS